jgi:hypothetical protein
MDHTTEYADQEAALRAEVEAMFPVYPLIGNHSLSATGEEYIEIVSGYKTIARCGSLEDAIQIWRWRLRHYIESMPSNALHISSPTVLYWRMLPEIGKEKSQHGILTRDFWGIYSRLLISNKPATKSQVVERPHGS